MKIAKEKTWIAVILGLSFLGFVGLSWWLLFRDERALPVFQSWYPQLGNSLVELRHTLLGLGLNVLPTFLFAGLAVISFGAYLLSFQVKFTLAESLKWAILFQVIVFFSYPIFSTDIFSYMYSDRVFTEYGQNIWRVIPLTYPDDRFEPLADWKDQTKVYGALNQILYLPAAYLGQDDLVLTLLGYKMVPFIASLLTMLVVLKLSDHRKPDEQAKIIRLLFWNPVFVLEIIGAAHNDILMILFLLMAWLAWQKKKWLMAGVLLALSVQIKLLSVVFLGFAGLWLLQKARWRELLLFSSSFLGINTLAFVYMGVSPLAFLSRVLYNTSVYWQSLPNVIHRFWSGEKTGLTVALLAMVGWLIYRQLKEKVSPLESSAWALLNYLLFFAAAYWNWYVLWVLFLVPFVSNSKLKHVTLTFCFTSFMAYPLLWLAYRLNHTHIFWLFASYLWIFGVPLGVWYLSQKKPQFFSSLSSKFQSVLS